MLTIMDQQKLPVINSKYFCSKCDYYTNKTSSYNKHLTTNKHLKEVNEIVSNDIFECNSCNRIYKSRVGLWKHKKVCKESVVTSINDDKMDALSNAIMLLVKENQDFKQIIIDQNAKMMEMAGNMGGNNHSNNNNTNSNNKFNLNVFLNEQCKDAMSLKDFVKNLEISMDLYRQIQTQPLK